MPSEMLLESWNYYYYHVLRPVKCKVLNDYCGP